MSIAIEGLTHWSIPVNDLEESIQFYRDLLGLEYKGTLTNNVMACFDAGGTSLLLCERKEPLVRSVEQDNRLHHSFTVSAATLEEACKTFSEKGVKVYRLYYRDEGFFLGRELYFQDPSGNLLELRDPTWVSGMPTPSYEEIVAAAPAVA